MNRKTLLLAIALALLYGLWQLGIGVLPVAGLAQQPTEACLAAAERMTQFIIEDATERGLPVKTPAKVEKGIREMALRLQEGDSESTKCNVLLATPDTTMRAFARVADREKAKELAVK